MYCVVSPNMDWISLRPLKILVRTGIVGENCLPVAIIDITWKVLGWIEPTSLLKNTNLHSQYERKDAKKIHLKYDKGH